MSLKRKPVTKVGQLLSGETEDTPSDPDPDPERSGDGEADGTPEPLPLGQVFELLSNPRRRQVLRLLWEHDGPSSLSRVAEQVAAWENDKDVRDLTSSERKRTYVGLYQCHLPKMDDYDVIEFDKHRGDIELGPRAPRMFEYLEQEETRPWAPYYLGLSGIWGGVFLAGIVADVDLLASPVVTGLSLLTFSLCSVAHYLDLAESDGLLDTLSTRSDPEER